MIHDHTDPSPLTRRSALKCLATWAGTGVMWSLVGGVPRAFAASAAGLQAAAAAGASEFHFVQISDTHVGFNKAANPEPLVTLQSAIDRANAMMDGKPADAPDAAKSDDPVARLRARADTMATNAAALKKIADAADPLYKTLDEGQKRRLAVLAHMEGRPGGGWWHRGEHGPRMDGDRGPGDDRSGPPDHP